MNQKTIQTILFAFFLFSFNLVKSEEPKLKIVKVKEFNSYEEYEKFKGLEERKIKIVNDKICFFDKNNNLLKEKVIDRIVLYDIFGRRIGEKDTIYYKQRKLKDGDILETAYIMPNNKKIIIEKVIINEKENIIKGYDILDENGTIIGQIEDRVEIYIPPNGEYYVGLEKYMSDLDGDVKFYNSSGVLYASHKVFDFIGSPEISFSLDSKYVALSVYAGKKNGIVIFDKDGSILWKKIDSCTFDDMTFSSSNDLLAVSSRNRYSNDRSYKYKLVVFSTRDGTKMWEYRASGVIPAISFSPDENKIVIFEYYYISPEKIKGSVQILSVKDGTVITKITLPTAFRWLNSHPEKILQTSNRFILARVGYELKPSHVEDVYVIDYNGQIIGKERVSYSSVDSKPYIILSNDEIVIIGNTNIKLYEVKEQ